MVFTILILLGGMAMYIVTMGTEIGQAMGDTMVGNRYPTPTITQSTPSTKPHNKETIVSKPSKITEHSIAEETMAIPPSLDHKRHQEVKAIFEEAVGIGVEVAACTGEACMEVDMVEGENA